MNLQPKRMNGSVCPRSKRRDSEKIHCYGGFVFKFVLLFLGFMGVLVFHLYLRQQCVKTAERTDDIKKAIVNVQVENRNLRNHLAKLTGWEHISSKIREFKLPLAPAEPGQIIRIGVYTPEQAATIPLTPLKVASVTGGTSPFAGR